MNKIGMQMRGHIHLSIGLALLLLLSVLSVTQAAPAEQQPVHITLTAANPSAMRTGTVQPSAQDKYVVHGEAGQQLQISMHSRNAAANFGIEGVSDGKFYKQLVDDSRTLTLDLPSTQDYLIYVAASTPTRYTLLVSVHAEDGAASSSTPAPTATFTATPTPEEIRFKKGEIAATRAGTIEPASQKAYDLRALAGQTLELDLASTDQIANFAVSGVSDGTSYKELTDEDRSWSLKLPRTQHYLIAIAPTATITASITYTLGVHIDPLPTPTPSPTPHPQRIRFAPGGTSATLHGSVRPPGYDRYLINAMRGQPMTVEIESPGGVANFSVTGVSDGQPYKRSADGHHSFSMELPRTQDYEISVSTTHRTDYTLMVAVDPLHGPSPSDEPERVHFARGAVSATLHGAVSGAEFKKYILGANAGQRMSVELETASGDANFSITGASDGQPYKRVASGDHNYSFRLPRSQDYIIAVEGDGGDVRYSLTVSIR